MCEVLPSFFNSFLETFMSFSDSTVIYVFFIANCKHTMY